mmetsp:Transcript_47257/g.151442  ORF Transcript_47257/g.151442 Transcript_47257/m.151442 type:complete len:355 (-) Transcript_47257:547-1611(-)
MTSRCPPSAKCCSSRLAVNGGAARRSVRGSGGAGAPAMEPLTSISGGAPPRSLAGASAESARTISERVPGAMSTDATQSSSTRGLPTHGPPASCRCAVTIAAGSPPGTAAAGAAAIQLSVSSRSPGRSRAASSTATTTRSPAPAPGLRRALYHARERKPRDTASSTTSPTQPRGREEATHSAPSPSTPSSSPTTSPLAGASMGPPTESVPRPRSTETLATCRPFSSSPRSSSSPSPARSATLPCGQPIIRTAVPGNSGATDMRAFLMTPDTSGTANAPPAAPSSGPRMYGPPSSSPSPGRMRGWVNRRMATSSPPSAVCCPGSSTSARSAPSARTSLVWCGSSGSPPSTASSGM